MFATVLSGVLLYVTFACSAIIESDDKCSGYQLECPEDDTCISLNSKCLSANREPGEECTTWTSEVRWLRCPEGKCDSSVGDWCHDITTCDTMHPQMVNISDTTFESCYSPDPIPNIIMTPSLPSGKHYDYLFFEYKCLPGYQMVGDKYQFCSNGKWCGKTPKCVRISSGTTQQSPPSWLTSSILIGPTTSFRSFSPSMPAIRTPSYTPVRSPTVYMPPVPRPLPPPSFRPPPPPVIQHQPRFATAGPRPFGASKPSPFVPRKPVPTGAGKLPQFRPRRPVSAGPASRPVPGRPLHKNIRGPGTPPEVKVSQGKTPKEATNTDQKISKIDPTEVKNTRNSAGNSETVPKVIAKVEEVNTKQKSSGMESPNQKSANSGAISSNQKISNQEEESTNQKLSTSKSELTNQKQPEGISRVFEKIESTNAKVKPATSGVESADKISDGAKTLKAESTKQKWIETLLKAIGKGGNSDAKQKQTSAKSGKSEKSEKSSDSEKDTDQEKQRSESEGSRKPIFSRSSGGGTSISMSSDIGQPLSAGDDSDAAHMRPDSNSLRLPKVSPPGIEIQPMPPRSIRQRRRAGSSVNRSRPRPRTPTVSQTRAGTRTIIGPRKRARPDLQANSRKLPSGTGRSPQRKPLVNHDRIPPPDITLSNSDSSTPSRNFNMKDKILPRRTDEDVDILPSPRRTLSKDDSLPPPRKTFANSDSLQSPSNTDEDGDIPPPPRRSLSKDDSLPSPRKTFANSDSLQQHRNTDGDGDIPPPPRRTLSKDDGLQPPRKTFANGDSLQPPSNTDGDGDIPPPPRRTLSKDDSLPPPRKTFANSDSLQPPSNTDGDGDIPPPPRRTLSKDDIPPPPRRTLSKDDSLAPPRKTFANSDSLQSPSNTDEDGDIPPPPRRTLSKDDSLPPPFKTFANSDSLQPPSNTDGDGDIPPPPRRTLSKDDSLPPPRKTFANSDSLQPPGNADKDADIPPPPRRTLSKDDSLPPKSSTNRQPSHETDKDGYISPSSHKSFLNGHSIPPSDTILPKQSPSAIGTDKESPLTPSKQISSIEFDKPRTQSISKIPQPNEPQQRDIQQSQKSNSKENPSSEIDFNTQKVPPSKQETITLQKISGTHSSKAEKQEHSEIDSKQVAKQSVLGSAFSILQKLPGLVPKIIETSKDSDNTQKTAISDSANQQLLTSLIDSVNQEPITSSVDSAKINSPISAVERNPSIAENYSNRKQLTTGTEPVHQNPSILKIEANQNPTTSGSTHQKPSTSDAKSTNQKHEIQSTQKAASPEMESTNETPKIKGKSGQETSTLNKQDSNKNSQDATKSKIAQEKESSDKSMKTASKSASVNSNINSFKSSSTDLGQPLSGGVDGGGEGSSIGGADPAPTEYICRANEWTCNDGSCINETNRCDGYIDCPDSSDEWECSINALCTLPSYPDHGIYTRRVDANTTVPASPSEEFDIVLLHISCDDGYDATIKDIICINGTWMNEMPKCENLDVINKLPNNSANWCTSTQWRCNDGGCIDNKERCDGKNDCYDRSDELYCTVKDKNSYSNCVVPDHPPNGMYMFSPPYNPGREVIFVNVSVECDDGFRADKESVSCSDGEWNGKNPECIQLLSTANCSEGQWQCINGECISLTSKCDGHYDCIDHTDEAEELCSKYDDNLNPILCRVPFIDNGIYTINDHPEIQPGEALTQMFLKVTCDADHMLQGMLMTLCMKGRWLTPIPKCTRYCLLKQHPSMQYQCKVMENGVTGVRPCREKEPIGTVVKLNCSMHYYSEDYLPDIKCTEFGWSHSQTCKAECGTLTPHVKKLSIGGRVANRSDVPWHAGIYLKTRDKINNITNYEQVCGGTLISYSIVLSAAHCFHGNDDRRISRRQFAVGIGKIYRLWDDPLEIAEDVQKSDVKRIIIPESYHSHATYYQSDIALVEVTKPFEHRAHIVPVCLDLDTDFDERHINGGVYGKVAGWGYMNEYGDSSPVLKILDEPIFNHSYCFSKVPAQSRPLITSDKICAGYTDGTQALCGGDSGGGLSIPEVRRGIERYYLRGVVSTTTSSASSGKLCNIYSLTYFTRVVHHTSLITQWWSPI